jgi:hypothetical protein
MSSEVRRCNDQQTFPKVSAYKMSVKINKITGHRFTEDGNLNDKDPETNF